MLTTDVVVAGAGVAGLLIASALASKASVILLEQADDLPRNKYWLTDDTAALANPHLKSCIDRNYKHLDYIAYDGLTASVPGEYCLWNTDRLINELSRQFEHLGGKLLTGHRLYSISRTPDAICIRANNEVIRARLLIDCMGFGSPLVGALDVAKVVGYYFLCGSEVRTRGDVISPVALDNTLIHKHPMFFEFFPTSTQTAHAAVILPSFSHRPDRSVKAELNFILAKSHYSEFIVQPDSPLRNYFGIIPVGKLRKRALDRVIFFGEAGQANPAASATGLSRMLHTYRDLADATLECLRYDALRERDLAKTMPLYMTRMNHIFQENVFADLLSFNSEDFRRLVVDLKSTSPDLVNDLIFARFDFLSRRTLPLALRSMLRPNSVLGSNILKTISHFCTFR